MLRISEVGEMLKLARALCATKRGEHFGLEDAAHGFEREQELARGWAPARFIEGQATGGHDGVDVRMQLEFAGPGVQHERGIQSQASAMRERFERLTSGSEQELVDRPRRETRQGRSSAGKVKTT
jgi:hypothetical protein